MALHLLLQPYQATPDDPFDRVKAAHLLNRAGFGGTPAEIDQVLKLGPRGAVEWLLDFPDASAEQQSPDDLPDLSSIAQEIDGQPFPRNFRQIAAMLAGKSQDERQALRQKLMMAQREALSRTVGWWLARMASGKRPLQEKLTLFWHGHFTTSAKDERSAALMWQQNELLRTHAASNFRTFVKAISRDPAMLDYLNNQQNRRRRPNENYARELMELFTLGIGHYTEDDVREAARAFTGWGHDGDEFVFRRGEHDFDEKVFFGRKGNFDGDDVIDLILAKRQCANHIAGKLFTFFAFDEPDDKVVASLGRVLFDGKYELRPALRTLLTSRAFYSPRAVGQQIKSPVQLVIGTLRALEAPMPPVPLLMRQLGLMGQMPLNPPNVKGWPGGRMWINTATLFVRYNVLAGLVGMNAAKLTLDEKSSPKEVAGAWVDRLIARPIPDDKLQVLADALDGRPDRSDNVRRMIQLIVAMPEYQLC